MEAQRKVYEEGVWNKLIESAIDISEDTIACNKCQNAICEYSRVKAIQCLNELITHYEPYINQLGCLHPHFTIWVAHNVDYSLYSDDEIKQQLYYIGKHIPIYVCLREGEKELVSKLITLIY